LRYYIGILAEVLRKAINFELGSTVAEVGIQTWTYRIRIRDHNNSNAALSYAECRIRIVNK
jgi:hypothetical protein